MVVPVDPWINDFLWISLIASAIDFVAFAVSITYLLTCR